MPPTSRPILSDITNSSPKPAPSYSAFSENDIKSLREHKKKMEQYESSGKYFYAASLMNDAQEDPTDDVSSLNSSNQSHDSLLDDSKHHSIFSGHDDTLLAEFYQKLDSLNVKNEELHEKISLLETENDKQRALLQQKDTINAELSKEQKSEKLTKKHQDELNQLHERIVKFQEQLQQEKMLRIKAEEHASEQQMQVQNAHERVKITMNELDSVKKLMRLLEEKYRQSETSLHALKEKYNIDSNHAMKDKEEIFALRREVSEMCETVLAEKQKTEDFEKQIAQLTKHNTEYKALVSDLQENERELKKIITELEQSQEMTKARNEKLKTQFTASKQEAEKEQSQLMQKLTMVEAKIAMFEDRELQYKSNIEQLNGNLAERAQEIVSLKKQIESLNQQIKEKTDAEKLMKDKRTNLLKKLDKEVRGHKKALEKIKETETKMGSLSQRIQELEGLLISREKKSEHHLQRISHLEKEIASEKTKYDRTWSELESTMTLLKAANAEKDALQQQLQEEHELKQKDLENKLKMMENKCNYYERLNQLVTSKKGGDEAQKHALVKRLHEDMLELLAEIEQLTESLHTQKVNAERLTEAHEDALERLRQSEDLLLEANQKRQQTNQKRTQSRGTHLREESAEQRLVIMEQCIDEILVETQIRGVSPSKMTVREKFVAIMNQIQKMRDESKGAQRKLDLSEVQIQKLQNVRLFLERRYLATARDENTEATSAHNLEQLNHIFEQMEALTEERNDLQEQLESMKQDSNSSVLLSEKASGTVLNLLNTISEHLREHETLLLNRESQDLTSAEDKKLIKQFNNIHIKFKDLIYQLESTPLSQSTSSSENGASGVLQTSSKQMSLIRQDEQITKLKYKIVTLEEELKHLNRAMVERDEQLKHLEQTKEQLAQQQQVNESLVEKLADNEERLSKMVKVNKEYKEVIAQFTQLHEQQRQQEALQREKLEKKERKLEQSKRANGGAGGKKPSSYAGLHRQRV